MREGVNKSLRTDLESGGQPPGHWEPWHHNRRKHQERHQEVEHLAPPRASSIPLPLVCMWGHAIAQSLYVHVGNAVISVRLVGG